MPGRHRGRRGQNRNHQGNNNGPRRNNNNINNRPAQREHKFATLNTGNVSRFHPFETVKQQLAQKLQANKDMVKVAEAIDKMEEIDFNTTKPTRTVSTINIFIGTGKDAVKDPVKVDEREVEQEGFDVEWKLKMEEWHEQKRTYEDGMISASAMIMNDYVTFGLHSKILNLDTYETKLKKNPIKLQVYGNK